MKHGRNARLDGTPDEIEISDAFISIKSIYMLFWKEFTLYLINTHFDAAAMDRFWKLCEKRRKCS